ncbi:MAG: flavin reductase [Anaeroplasmataceae bacterium]
MLKLSILHYDKNIFDELQSNWGIVTSNCKDKKNIMTISWGSIGVMWNKNVVFVFIRPTRYSFDLIENSNMFTLSFFNPKYKNSLSIAGTTSGKDQDKFIESGFTPLYDIDNDVYYIKEASYVFKLKKLYKSTINECDFIDKSLINKFYPKKDFHHMYVAEITEFLVNEVEE